MSKPPCSVDECERKVLARNLCATHYQRWRTGAPLDTPIKHKNPGALCTIDGCGRKRAGRGLCTTHFERQRQGVPLDRPVRSLLKPDVDLATRLRHYAPEGKPDECWEWTMARNKNYGMISIGKSKLRGAHIVAWELANKRALPPGLVITHSCDNPPCTNPKHLVLGTHGDNVNDKVSKERQSRGKDNGMAKLTDADVRTIRRLYEAGMAQRTIAEQFGIIQSNVSAIVRRRTWKHV